jgi:hypothetical protein
MVVKNKKAQIWSLDSIIASVIFVTSIVVIALILTLDYTKVDPENLEEENSKINQLISGSDNLQQPLSFLIGPNVNTERLKRLHEYEYKDLRNQFGIKGDFCIYFEDMNGNIINISTYTGKEKVGFGDNKINLTNSITC